MEQKMKKYIITSADGKRRLTQTTYASREEAGDALMYYIDTNNAGYPKQVYDIIALAIWNRKNQ